MRNDGMAENPGGTFKNPGGKLQNPGGKFCSPGEIFKNHSLIPQNHSLISENHSLISKNHSLIFTRPTATPHQSFGDPSTVFPSSSLLRSFYVPSMILRQCCSETVWFF